MSSATGQFIGDQSTLWQPSRRALAAGGQPISELMHRELARPDLISLAAGFVDFTTLPVQETRRGFDELFREEAAARSALQYGVNAGDPSLREKLLKRLSDDDGVNPDDLGWSTDRMILTAGSNQLLHLVAETLLNPGDIVLCAAPTYFVFLGALQNVHARSVGVATDEYGIVPEALEREFKRLDELGELGKVKGIYLVSYFDNPTGTTLPLERRRWILEIAKHWSRRSWIHVLEDIAYRDLRYEGADIPSMASLDKSGETVVLAGTFSKCFSPGIRVGWGLLPKHLVEPVSSQKANIDFGSPHLSQRIMDHVLGQGLLDRHIAQLREAYREKRDAMLTALDEQFGSCRGAHWRHPEGGLYVWLTLPPEMDAGPNGPLLESALAEGVLYVPGEYSYPAEGAAVAKNTMRLSFGVQSSTRIREGIVALRKAVRVTYGG